MARKQTGVGKKSNRQNLAALDLCHAWRRQFGIEAKMSPEFAWVFSNGKVGTKPANWGQSGLSVGTQHGEPTYDTFKIALAVVKERGGVI